LRDVGLPAFLQRDLRADGDDRSFHVARQNFWIVWIHKTPLKSITASIFAEMAAEINQDWKIEAT
jgi:hypothetical protein